jgi:hypothetical protein
MPVYVYTCKHETKELLLSQPKPQKCSCGCSMTRNYSSERAGLPPFKGYTTDMISKGMIRVDTRSEERALEKKTGFARVR